MKEISQLINYEFKVNKQDKRLRRKLAIEDLKQLLGWVDNEGSELWRLFSFPTYIPTEWIEDYTHKLIPIGMYERREKLFEYLKKK